ncbi:unnamed protein product [Cuscuta campestris]|uniref:Uncharacterized protein n=1 Tax=Cuscuta campestris TaxID=132261 RepID=A0A484LSK9_9ASTE|nr:unnamed protein product [Cuscuta campestris]
MRRRWRAPAYSGGEPVARRNHKQRSRSGDSLCPAESLATTAANRRCISPVSGSDRRRRWRPGVALLQRSNCRGNCEEDGDGMSANLGWRRGVGLRSD